MRTYRHMLVGKPQLLKNLNSDIVRDLIYKEGPVSKPEIAERTALSLPTVKKRVELLLREGWIRESGRSGEGVGRKATMYEADRSHNMILMLYKNCGFTAYLVDITGMIHFEKRYTFLQSDIQNMIYGQIICNFPTGKITYHDIMWLFAGIDICNKYDVSHTYGVPNYILKRIPKKYFIIHRLIQNVLDFENLLPILQDLQSVA